MRECVKIRNFILSMHFVFETTISRCREGVCVLSLLEKIQRLHFFRRFTINLHWSSSRYSIKAIIPLIKSLTSGNPFKRMKYTASSVLFVRLWHSSKSSFWNSNIGRRLSVPCSMKSSLDEQCTYFDKSAYNFLSSCLLSSVSSPIRFAPYKRNFGFYISLMTSSLQSMVASVCPSSK